MICPCGSSENFRSCCEPFILETKLPDTPEQLMRSRYTAYTLVNVDYLIKTTHPKMRKHYSAKSIREWAENCEWEKLEVVKAFDQFVHFKAYFKEDGEPQIHEEFSTFALEKNRWYFVDGKHPES